MKKRAFTLIEALIAIFIVSFLVIFFASLVYNKVDSEIDKLQDNVTEYYAIIDSYKEVN